MNHPLFFSKDNKQEEFPFQEDLEGKSSSPEQLQHKFDQWKTERERIRQLFSERKLQEARKPMIDQLSCFIQALYWANKRRVDNLVQWQDTVASLPVKPVNTVERLEMIFNRPAHFTAWIQLNELFSEMEKKVAGYSRFPRQE
ncbi:hypothetical protein SAMN04488137_1833 [Fictibacillus solisalsi]|uniref:YpoC-like domain-containing protein n=1 Tax=Fictibacillus solisalsi TaxID=459525 RepID=A0A1G9VXI0_9BACL|nr:hypothetical protein [Fictibacillus solisalsi]SDM76545.1 hypothetical protein SAMN04488137_1833 [Fictibacillus solisalsi]